MSERRDRVLCVDDEPHVVAGLALTLRRRYDVLTAVGGSEGLRTVADNADLAVIISDMRMPGLDGVVLLNTARQVAPDTTRILLTGHADVESAISAINEGGIFRFLTKPVTPPVLLRAVDEAARQHRLVTAERELLEKTLQGAIRTMSEILAHTNPLAFGRATRLKELASELAARLELSPRWPIEVAAVLSQLGFVTLPRETAEKLYYVQTLDGGEKKMVERSLDLGERMAGNIPRLEVVRAIVAGMVRDALPPPSLTFEEQDLAGAGARVLKVALDYDRLETMGLVRQAAIDRLRQNPSRYAPRVVDALEAVRGGGARSFTEVELPIAALRPGMRLVSDLKTARGVLVVARGQEVTAGLIERLANYRHQSLREPVRVVAGPDEGAALEAVTMPVVADGDGRGAT